MWSLHLVRMKRINGKHNQIQKRSGNNMQYIPFAYLQVDHHITLLSSCFSTYLASFYGLLETIPKVNRLEFNRIMILYYSFSVLNHSYPPLKRQNLTVVLLGHVSSYLTGMISFLKDNTGSPCFFLMNVDNNCRTGQRQLWAVSLQQKYALSLLMLDDVSHQVYFDTWFHLVRWFSGIHSFLNWKSIRIGFLWLLESSLESSSVIFATWRDAGKPFVVSEQGHSS